MANEKWKIRSGSRRMEIDGVTVSGVTAAILNALTTAGLALVNALTATADEINAVADASARLVTTTATTLALTFAAHAERDVVIETNSSSGCTITLPTATGSGAKLRVINGIAQTQGNITINTASTLQSMKGRALAFDSAATGTHQSFFRTATATQMQWNRTTKGGIGEDDIVLQDVGTGAGAWRVSVVSNCSGAPATPFA